jgi:hypothetical protein
MNPMDDDDGVPPGGRFDKETYERARAAVLQQQLDEQFPGKYDENLGRERSAKRATKRATKPSANADQSQRFPPDMRARGAYRGQRSDASPPGEYRGQRADTTPAARRADAEKREEAGRANLKRLQEYDRPLERVEPEAFLPPLRPLRGAIGAAGAARAAGRELADTAPVARFLGRGEQQRMAEQIGVNKPKLLTRSPDAAGARQLSAPPSRGGPASAETRKLANERPTPRPKPPPRDAEEARFADEGNPNFRRGGKVAGYAKGGAVGAKRGDGCCQRGYTKGKFV